MIAASAADNPDDYTTVILAFSFTMEDSQSFTVTTIEDTFVEGAETLSVMFAPFTGPTNPGPNLDLTITDDDGKLPHPHIHDAYIYTSMQIILSVLLTRSSTLAAIQSVGRLMVPKQGNLVMTHYILIT